MTTAKKHPLTAWTWKALLVPALITGFLASSSASIAQDLSNGADNFYKSDKVTTEKVTFKNKFKMKVVGNLFLPKALEKDKKYPAVIVGHPFGAVKEQSANLYAQKLAEKGFVTLTFDLSFWGESEGEPRGTVSPEIYVDDFSAAVDFLGTNATVDSNRIGVLGICASGSFSIAAAKIDPRLKAIATVSMYDMGSAYRNGLKNSVTPEQLKKVLKAAAEQRSAEYTGAKANYKSGVPETLDDTTDPVGREFYDFYRTSRGQSPRTTTMPIVSSTVAFANFDPFARIETISKRPLLFIAGDKAHSKEFSEDAYKKAAEPKELFLVKDAGHVDLYDRVKLIPFDKLTEFFTANLK